MSNFFFECDIAKTNLASQGVARIGQSVTVLTKRHAGQTGRVFGTRNFSAKVQHVIIFFGDESLFDRLSKPLKMPVIINNYPNIAEKDGVWVNMGLLDYNVPIVLPHFVPGTGRMFIPHKLPAGSSPPKVMIPRWIAEQMDFLTNECVHCMDPKFEVIELYELESGYSIFSTGFRHVIPTTADPKIKCCPWHICLYVDQTGKVQSDAGVLEHKHWQSSSLKTRSTSHRGYCVRNVLDLDNEPRHELRLID